MKTAIAIAAHPDDIEFMMAGTLLLLKDAGYDIHYMNLASGSCGSVAYDAAKTRKIRLEEARKAAEILGAHFHAPLCDDLEIMYNTPTLRRLAAIVREVQPSILLTHSPADYMEDHTNTCRLAVTAAFTRGMPNFETEPAKLPENYDCTVYHALPHGLRDSLRRRVMAGAFVNTASVHTQKMEALKAHQSQQQWLDASQKMNSYLQTMEDVSLEVGRMSQRFKYAEGWRRHLHYGFCESDADPLQELSENYFINEIYEQNLENGH